MSWNLPNSPPAMPLALAHPPVEDGMQWLPIRLLGVTLPDKLDYTTTQQQPGSYSL